MIDPSAPRRLSNLTPSPAQVLNEGGLNGFPFPSIRNDRPLQDGISEPPLDPRDGENVQREAQSTSGFNRLMRGLRESGQGAILRGGEQLRNLTRRHEREFMNLTRRQRREMVDLTEILSEEMRELEEIIQQLRSGRNDPENPPDYSSAVLGHHDSRSYMNTDRSNSLQHRGSEEQDRSLENLSEIHNIGGETNCDQPRPFEQHEIRTELNGNPPRSRRSVDVSRLRRILASSRNDFENDENHIDLPQNETVSTPRIRAFANPLELRRNSVNPERRRSQDAIRELQNRICTICRETTNVEQILSFICGCLYCKSCLRNRFIRAIQAEYLFPVKCCDFTVNLAHAEYLLPPDVVRNYRVKQIERGTTDRTYCSNKRCSTFITKENIQGDQAFCHYSPCHTVTCIKCKSGWHEGNCTVDKALQKVLDVAKSRGWKRCAKCNHVIEHAEGCDHMTCVCGYQFCYHCMAVWKTCHCRVLMTIGIGLQAGSRRTITYQNYDGNCGNNDIPVEGMYGEVAGNRDVSDDFRGPRVPNMLPARIMRRSLGQSSGTLQEAPESFAASNFPSFPWTTALSSEELLRVTSTRDTGEQNQPTHTSEAGIARDLGESPYLTRTSAHPTLYTNDTINRFHNHNGQRYTGCISRDHANRGVENSSFGSNTVTNAIRQGRVGLQDSKNEMASNNRSHITLAGNSSHRLDSEARSDLSYTDDNEHEHRNDGEVVQRSITNIPRTLHSPLRFEFRPDDEPCGQGSTPSVVPAAHDSTNISADLPTSAHDSTNISADERARAQSNAAKRVLK